MQGRKPTKAEKEYMRLSLQIPCIVCADYHDAHDSPAEYHHTEGKTKAGAHFRGLSLCARHHRHKDNQTPPRWISRHGDGKAAFEERYTTEEELVFIQQERVNALKERIV